ncbi:MAG: MFS transporter [Chloroflexi bacterium]|nr:MAG: MFS transporter [Chloroflexota bacterium]
MVDPIRLPVEATPGGFRGTLRHTAFRNIWFAQLAAQLADKFLLFSLIILAYNINGGSTSVAVTLLAYTVPAVLFAPPAGVIADRFDRKQIMLWSNFLRAGVVALIPIASIVPGVKGDFLHLIVITLVFSAVGQLFGPAEAAVIPTILPRQALITANSMALLTMVLTLVVGERHTESPVEESRSRFRLMLLDLQEGIDALRTSRGLRLAFGQVTIAVLVLFNLYTLAPAYVSKVIGIAAQDTYVILGPATAGAILSAVLLGQFLGHIDRARLLAGSLLANGLTLLALAAVPEAMSHFPDLQVHNRITGATFSLLLGVEFGAILIPAITYLMESTSDAIRGRVFALLYMVINGVSALPVLLAAALADNIGTAQVLGGLGVLLLGGGIGVIAGGMHAPAPQPGPTQSAEEQ